MTNFGMMVSSLKQNIARAVVGKDDVVELMLTALLCEGHVLIEDVPRRGQNDAGQRAGAFALLLVQAHSVHAGHHPVGYHGLHHAQPVRRNAVSSRRNHESDCAGPTKSTAPLRKRSPRCWRLWKSGR